MMSIQTQLPNPIATVSLLQQWQWIVDPVNYMETAAQQYPDIFSASVIGFGDSFVFVNHPRGIQEILTNDRKIYGALSEPNRLLEPLVGQYSVILLQGDRHKRERQFLMPAFHGDHVRSYADIICDVTNKAFSCLPDGQPFKARQVTQEISLLVILKVVFGLIEGERYQQLKQLLTTMLEQFNSPLKSGFLFVPFLQRDLGSWSPWGRFLQERAKIDALIYAEIGERRQNPDPDRTDVLSMLLAARDEAGQPMTDQELRDELVTFLTAGHETTATAMAWALYWTHRFPAIKQKLLQEIATLGDQPDPLALTRLPYLTAVCHETLRIYPVAMLTFPRVAQQSVELMGYPLKSGTITMGCIYLAHQREDLYPNHKQFRPERFLERTYSPYEFLPFGGGVRRCIGEVLALYEMKLALATVLTHYDLALASDRPELPHRRGVTLAPKHGVPMVKQ